MKKLLSVVFLIPACTFAQMNHSIPGAMDDGLKKITSYNFPLKKTSLLPETYTRVRKWSTTCM